MLTPAQRKSFERGIASADAVEDKLRYLEQIAAASPIYADRVKQLRVRQEYLKTLGQIAISAHNASMDGS